MSKANKKTIKQILQDRKAGMMIGQLSWKYDLTISQVDRICKEQEDKG